jgi:hypothetical protein
MREGLDTFEQFLEQPVTTRSDQAARMAVCRARVEKSSLITTLDDICAEINGHAKKAIITVQDYLPPEHLIRVFSFHRSDFEFILQIELWGEKPTLTFLSRRGDDLPTNPSVRFFYELRYLLQGGTKIKFSQLVRDESLSREEVEGWFIYLLSGLDRRFRPQPRSGSVVRSGRRDEQRSFRVRMEELGVSGFNLLAERKKRRIETAIAWVGYCFFIGLIALLLFLLSTSSS